MVYCSIVGCKNRSGQNSNCKLFKVPAVISNQGEKYKLLTEERRLLWISRINRKNLTVKRYTAVCSIHFVKGAPSEWHDKTSPDWAPSLNLGYDSNNLKIMKSVGNGRYIRAKGREKKKKSKVVTYADSTCMTLVTGEDLLKLHDEIKQLNIDLENCKAQIATLENENGKLFENNVKQIDVNVSLASNIKELADNNNMFVKENERLVTDNVALRNECVRLKEALNGLLYGTNVELADDSAGLAINMKTLADSNFKFVRANEKLITDNEKLITDNEILTTDKEKLIKCNEKLDADNMALRNEMMKVKNELKKRTFDEDSLRNKDEKVKFYTGIPSFSRLQKIYNLVTAEVKEIFDPNVHKLTRFQEFLMVLMRLRLNLFEADLGFRFDVAQSTVSRIISKWLPFMANRLKPLIMWPEREILRATMPQSFRDSFGDNVAVIIDCFEVFTDKPSSLLPRASTWSQYKHHHTIKFLIGITPQGSISFISKAWVGRTTDKEITESCGILNNLIKGDIVLADKGFNVDDSVRFYGARLHVPPFLRGKPQLSYEDVELTRKIGNVRIHVERIIGHTRKKFTILRGTLPIETLTKRKGENEAPIDHIVTICCALINLCPGIVSLE